MKKYLSDVEVENVRCNYIYKKEKCGGNTVFIKKRFFCDGNYFDIEFYRHNNKWSIDEENNEKALKEGVFCEELEKFKAFLNCSYVQKKKEIGNKEEYRNFYLDYEDADSLGYYEKASPDYVRVQYLLNNIKLGSVVYDVACNSGGIGKILKEERGCEVFGSDLCPNLVQKARDKGMTVYCGFAEDADFGNISFDYVIMSFILEHAIDPNILMEKSLQKLKKNGRLLGCVPTEFGDWGKHTLKYHPEHLRVYSEKEIFDLFDSFKLKNIQIEKVKLTGRSVADYYLFSAEK